MEVEIILSEARRVRKNPMAQRNHILDEIDMTILATMQDDGRITNVDLAARAGLTAPPCLRRVRALESAGIIESYHAKLNPAALGFGILVFAMVSLKSQAEDALKAFEAHA